MYKTYYNNCCLWLNLLCNEFAGKFRKILDIYPSFSFSKKKIFTIKEFSYNEPTLNNFQT